MSEKVTEVGIKWKIFKFKKHILILQIGRAHV